MTYISNKKEETTMEITIEKGGGLDVHKETVAACIMGTGTKVVMTDRAEEFEPERDGTPSLPRRILKIG